MNESHTDKSSSSKERRRGVSVIIASYNSAKRISETLRHIAHQTNVDGIPIEVLLLDNNSNDGTSEVARNAWDELGNPFPLQIIFHERPGVTGTRLRGFAESNYRFGIICDDDNWLAPDYVRRVVDIFESNPTIGAMCGVSHPEPQTFLPEWFTSYESLYACGDRGLETGFLSGIDAWVWGAGMGMRLDVFDELIAAGFQNVAQGRTSTSMLGAEDVEWCHWYTIAGYGIWFDHSLQITHFIEDRKLTDEYRMTLIEGIRLSNKFLDDYYPVIRGAEIVDKKLFSKVILVARTIAKILTGKNYQPEAVALLPHSEFLLKDGVSEILKSKERFSEAQGK